MARRARSKQGTLYRRRRGKREYGSWLCKFRVNGKAIQLNTHTEDYDRACEIFQEYRRQYFGGKLTPARIDMTVEEYARHFLDQRREMVTRGRNKESTLKRYRAVLNNFVTYVEQSSPGLKMAAVRTDFIQTYMNTRITQTRQGKGNVPITPVGVNKEVAFLSTVFRQAVKDGVIPVSPIDDKLEYFVVSRKRTREHEQQDIFTDQEVTMILDEIKRRDPDAYPIIAAIAMTGARRAELTHLRRENVDFENNLIHIEPDPDTGWTPKNEGSIRAVPMSPQLRRIMQTMLDAEQRVVHAYAFCLPDGRPVWEWEDWPLRRFQAAIRRLQKKGESVHNGHLRMLRHWFISTNLNRRENPINPVEMIRLVGHKDLSMLTRIYYHADMQAIADKMESFRVEENAVDFGLRVISA